MDNQTTVIGASSHIKGTLEGEENLNVVGRVDGNIALTKSLFVDPNGIVVADVQVHTAVISGSVIGNIRATDLIHITEEGRVVGDLSAPRVILVDGASFKGGIDMGDMDAPSSQRSASPLPPARRDPAETPVRTPRPVRKPPPRQEPLEQRAAAAAQAVTKAARAKAKAPAPAKRKTTVNATQAPAPKKKRAAPKPPTTAGKKSKARRK